MTASFRPLGSIREKVRQYVADPIAKPIVRSAAVGTSLRVAGVGLSYMANVLISRMLGLHAYGEYAIALSWVLVLTLPSRAGFDSSALRYSTVYLEASDFGALRGFIHLACAVVALTSLTMGAVLFFFTGPFVRADAGVLFWAGMMILPLALLAFFSAVMRTARQIAASQLYDQLLRPLFIIGGVALTAAIGVHFTTARALAVTTLAAFCALGLLLIHFRKVFRHAAVESPRYDLWRQWFAVSVPMLMLSVVLELMNQIDVMLLGYLANERQAGLFAASWRLASLVPFVLVALAMLGGPMVVSAYRRNAHGELQRIAALIARLGFGFGALAAAVLIFGGKFLLAVFGPEFVIAYPVLIILVLGGVVNSFTGIVAYLMTLTGHQRQALGIYVIALTMSVLLNILLIPRFGAIGSAAASSAATAAWNVAMLTYVWRIMGINSTALARGV